MSKLRFDGCCLINYEDDQRVVGQTPRIQRLEDPPDLVIHEADHPVVARHRLTKPLLRKKDGV